MKHCEYCKYPNGDDASFCSRCGKPMDGEPPKPPKKKSKFWTVYLIIGWVLSLVVTFTLAKSIYDRSPGVIRDPEAQMDVLNISDEQQEYLDRALEELRFFWADFYETDLEEYPYLEVKNARLIDIKEGQTGAFENVEYVVEFMLLTNYQSSEPYYANAGVYDMVVFYTDGTVEVTNNLFRIHSAATFDYDYTGIIESMEDLGPLGIQSLK